MTDGRLVFGSAHRDVGEFQEVGGTHAPCTDGYGDGRGVEAPILELVTPEFCRTSGLCPPAMDYNSGTTSVEGLASLQGADGPADMRVKLGGHLMRTALAEGEDVELKRLAQRAGEWLASILGVEGSLEVDVSFEDGEVVIVVTDGHALALDYESLEASGVLDRLHANDIIMDYGGEGSFSIESGKFVYAIKVFAGDV